MLSAEVLNLDSSRGENMDGASLSQSTAFTKRKEEKGHTLELKKLQERDTGGQLRIVTN